MTRADLRLIASLIPECSRVLDLGCGNGELLRLLEGRGCHGTGVEIEPELFLAALRHGVNVIDLDINSQLDQFADGAYDVVVLSRTLQNLRQPAEVLREMTRIASHGIVSMPNFVHWRNRLRLLTGRMPVTKDLPYSWYDSPNLHFTSLKDLAPLFTGLGLEVERCIPIDDSGRPLRTGEWGANLFASSAVYLLQARR
ncbi:methionine biosynthesis protein MetW [Arachnia rubra]|jgi:methionine biosynthesis protein metW|uniref:Methionine biosynthesis protein MetW n=1 Tax=Arachnia rubra TaxID=1547448 RepID=A0ABX7Y233_9ACTN|nr:methionine biosynthesis protein MetW [Arachnia rubra]MBB1571287.1 methionine biosynthesis protein MetW [Propionibacterium sp.]MDO4644329.1 methionine biosynthesis protein MetW [Propionibacteriaceae bacterium]QUC06838.1 methionine biosynthesis protein MetW [Arachnia rubra]BCR81041.1 methionine biosynthesis protein MetW [Arachnia rubra]